MNSWLRSWHIIVSIVLVHTAHAARIIPGNVDAGNESFTFSLRASARTQSGTVFYVGSRKQGNAGEFALSQYIESAKRFIALATRTARLNGQDNQDNPLYNAAIAQLSVFGRRTVATRAILNPIAVTQAEPATIYYVDNVTQVSNEVESCADDQEKESIVQVCSIVFSAEDIKDATGTQVTQEIIGLERFANEALFAAVTPNDSGDFGDPESGIAVIQLVHEKDENDQSIETKLVQIDAQPGDPPMPNVTRASALDVSSPSIKIGDDVINIENAIDMHYSSLLNRLYVALQVEGAPGADDGARAIVVGRLENQKLHFSPIAPAEVFTGMDKIAGATGPDAEVSMHAVRTMHTTTGLDYLIVLGDVGTPDQTDQSVFALPLVDQRLTGSIEPETQGTLANVQSDPQDFFAKTADTACDTFPQSFLGRSFVTPAQEPDQVFTNNATAAQVGGGDLPNGPITDINVSKDVVFVSVANTVNNEKPGIFASRALFDDAGVIQAWTPWERVAGTTDRVFAFSFQQRLGNFTWLTGSSGLNINTAKESLWGKGSLGGLADLVEVVSALLPQGCGGVQGFFDMPVNTPGLFDISLQVATGLNTVVLIESGQLNNDVLCPNFGDFTTDLKRFENGEITSNFPDGNTRVISISGGDLDMLGPIIAAALAVDQNTQQGYLFAGGACGLAVLAQPDGTGWSTSDSLSKGFGGLEQGMRFKAIGDYTFVRKLIYDEGFLYVLTDTRLDRIDIAASNFMTGELDTTTVATLEDIGKPCDGTLLDAVVSGKLALLASSTGLYRVGNEGNIQTAVDNQEVDWTSVVIPEGLPVVQQLQPVASNSLPNGLAKTDNGNLYILDAYRGFDFGQENRYTVQEVNGQPIDDQTIEPLPDMKIKDISTSFARFGVFRNLIHFDGTDNFSSRNRVQMRDPMVFNYRNKLPLDIEQSNSISTFLRSSASGAWMVAGDFGLRVNE